MRSDPALQNNPTNGEPPATAQDWRRSPLAVLVSGGVDSCVLAGELARSAPRVAPLYVRCGLQWEDVEELHLRRFLALIGSPVIEPLQVFQLPMTRVYGHHWSTTGAGVPDVG